MRAIVTKEAARCARPQESCSVLQQTVNFCVLQAITMAVILEAITLGRERQRCHEHQQPNQTCWRQTAFVANSRGCQRKRVSLIHRLFRTPSVSPILTL